MTVPEGRTALYRLYDTGDALLYVGITCNPEQRFTQHAAEKAWWPHVARRDVEWYETRTAALMAEEATIRISTPAENIDRNPMAPAVVTVTLPGHWLVGLDLLRAEFRGGLGPVPTRELAILGLLDRELAARGLLGDPACRHSGIGWPDGVGILEPGDQPCKVCNTAASSRACEGPATGDRDGPLGGSA